MTRSERSHSLAMSSDIPKQPNTFGFFAFEIERGREAFDDAAIFQVCQVVEFPMAVVDLGDQVTKSIGVDELRRHIVEQRDVALVLDNLQRYRPYLKKTFVEVRDTKGTGSDEYTIIDGLEHGTQDGLVTSSGCLVVGRRALDRIGMLHVKLPQITHTCSRLPEMPSPSLRMTVQSIPLEKLTVNVAVEKDDKEECGIGIGTEIESCARFAWMRVVNAMIANAKLAGLDPDTDQLLFSTLHTAEHDAEVRGRKAIERLLKPGEAATAVTTPTQNTGTVPHTIKPDPAA
jgi:hypothetical protein